MAALLAGCGGGGGGSAPAAPTGTTRFLQSDAYPLNSAQPNHFVVSCDSAAPVNSPPATDPSGARYLHFPLSGLGAGSHVCDVAAADASNAVSSTENVSFTL